MSTVLIVEDDSDVRESLGSILDFEQYDVVACADGAAALRALLRGLRPAAIVLDLMMPNMNGFEFLQAIRRFDVFARIPVIVTSVSSTYSAQDLGVREQLRKPYALTALTGAVRSAIDADGQRLSPS